MRGFAPIALMEDVELSRRLRRFGKIILLDPAMASSPAKQIEQGAWRVTFFLLLFRLGVDPAKLHGSYYAKKVTLRTIHVPMTRSLASDLRAD